MSDCDSLDNHIASKLVTHTSVHPDPVQNAQIDNNTQIVQPPRSLWTCLRWIFWFIVTGFLRCGRALVFSSDRTTKEASILTPVEENIIDLFTDNGDIESTQSTYSDCATLSVVVNECAYNPPISQQPELVYPKSDCELEKVTSNEKNQPNFFAELSSVNLDNCLSTSDFNPFSSDYTGIVNGFIPDHPTPVVNSPAFTLLNSVYLDSQNTLLNSIDLESAVDEIVKSVIPRNLSDCSGVTVCPEIRKMYAWNKIPNNCANDGNESGTNTASDMKSGICESDRHLAYPGKLTMSDNPSPPLSPSTLDSSTTAGESPCQSTNTSDINLPFATGKDPTLVWAMSNLRMHPNTDDPYGSSPPIRQSRDKSPVTTVNSLRMPDISSSPDFRTSSSFLLQEKSHSFCEPIPKPKRSSSLKSQRTPPGTPGSKSVRFADALGLDLETVRHVFDQEAPPRIPASATFGLELDSDESIAKLGAKQFGLCFAQPGSAPNFIRRVLHQTVCLEDAQVNMPRGILTGTVRVRSLGFEKRIIIRITYNNWATYCDTPASYVQGSHDGSTDRFSFSVVFPDTMIPGDRAQFAIRYEAHTGEHFWDNNHGQNYVVTCYAKATDLAGDGSWVHYL